MKIIQALLGEHGAIYPLFGLIEAMTSSAGLEQVTTSHLRFPASYL